NDSVVEIYTPTTDTWATAASMPTPRHGLAVTTGRDGKIYAFGGANTVGSGECAAAEVYDPALGTWATLPPLSKARYGLAAAAGADRRVDAIGGITGASNATITGLVEAFSPASGTWSTLPPLIAPRSNHVAIGVPDGRIFVVGGGNATNNYEDLLEGFGPS